MLEALANFLTVVWIRIPSTVIMGETEARSWRTGKEVCDDPQRLVAWSVGAGNIRELGVDPQGQ